jgi:hypothetical protein
LRPDIDLPTLKNSLDLFLRSWSKDRLSHYTSVFHDLNGDGKPEAIVYLDKSEWCGSGGCNTLILEPNKDSWKIISNITITWLPIRLLKKERNGWQSLGVWVQGGGIQPGYEAELDFNGRTYPTNPTVPPAHRLDQNTPEEILIPRGK